MRSAWFRLLLGSALVSGLDCMGQSASGVQNTAKATAAFRAGSDAYLHHDLATAQRQFAMAVRLAPQIAAGHAALATVLLAQGDAHAARSEFAEAHRLDPGNERVSVDLALTDHELGDLAAAAPLFRGLSPATRDALSPEEVIAFADSVASAGGDLEAHERIDSALRQTPKNAALLDALGVLDARADHPKKAEEEFRESLMVDPESVPAHLHLGSVLLVENRVSDAIVELRAAHSLDAKNIVVLIELGRALNASGQDADSIKVLRQALALDARSIDAQYSLALALQASENSQSALPLFREVLSHRPNSAEVLTNYGLALVQTGDAKAAVPMYERALKAAVPTPTLHEDFGVAYLQQSDLDHAIEQFNAGLALDPASAHLHYDLGLAYKLKDNLSAAISEFGEAQRLDPQLPDPPYTLGVLLMQQGKFNEAATSFERALALRPDNGEGWSLLGNVYRQEGETDKAIVALRRAIPLLPDQPSPHITLATILAQKGDTTTAAAERKIAADLSRAAVSHQRAAFALDSGRTLLRQGKVSEATIQLRTAAAAEPSNSEVHALLAEALTRQGQNAEAAVERSKVKDGAH